MSSTIVDGEQEMTENVNCNEEDRNRSVAVVPYTIHNVKKLEDGDWHSSSPFYVQGVKWDIGVKIGNEEQHSDSVFSFFLRYLGGAESSRPIVDVELELRLLNQMDTNMTYKKEFHALFDTSIQDKLGSSQFVFWSDILNPQRGYLKDDTIIVQVYIAAAPPLQKIDLYHANTNPPGIGNSSSSGKSKSDDERLQSQLSGMTVSDRAQNLLDSGIGWDCEFLVKDGEDAKTFRASKLFLAKFSEAFERMFFGSFEVESRIEVEDVKPAVFYQMLKYTYGCNWSLESRENAKDLYYLADRYLMDELKMLCLKYLWPKDVDSLWCAFDLATCNDLPELKTAALRIICEHTSDVFKSDNFLHLYQASLITILEQNQLNVLSEMQVFKAAHKWAASQCRTKGLPVNGANLRLELGRGMQYIRFLAMSRKDIYGEPYDSGILTAEEALAFVRASDDGNQYLPPSNLCPLRKPRQFSSSDQSAGYSSSPVIGQFPGGFQFSPTVFQPVQSNSLFGSSQTTGSSFFGSGRPRSSLFDSPSQPFSSDPVFNGGRLRRV
ncbi:uncharacterized protein [Anabrus simplex]|uniref:uncharacterized protein n=1 Tax=Anabrus simplex TaxID=316456 RepID=UPI0035A31B72